MPGVVVLLTVVMVPLRVAGVSRVTGVLVERVWGRAVDRVFRGGLVVVHGGHRASSPWSPRCPAASSLYAVHREDDYTPYGYVSSSPQAHTVIASSRLP